MARLDAHWHQTRVYHLKSSSLALGRVWWSLAGSALVASVTLNSTSVFSSTESGNRRRPQHCGISIETVLCFAGCSTPSSASHQKPVAGAPLCVPSGDNLSIFSHCQTLLRQTCIFENLWPRGSLGDHLCSQVLQLESGMCTQNSPEQLGLSHLPPSQVPTLAFTFQFYVTGRVVSSLRASVCLSAKRRP